MADWNPEVNELFAKVIELESHEEQRALLDETCGENADLRSGVERLLKAHNDAGSFLNKPPDGLAPTITTGEHDIVDESDSEFSLDFLNPTDKPNCLGTLAQYEAIEVVGRGGMGLVLRAYDTKLNRVVAIKVMAPELAANPMAVKRFLREARAAAAVSHEHVVTIHAIEEDNKPPFIVMEFVDGKSLQEKVDEAGSLELKEILRIGMQTARGLAAAHEQGLVHRDIKPANILLENGVERVQLTDFGLARATDDVSVTQTGQIAGTPQYMSPEQAEGKPLDARSDLFSLGSVLYTMCTGRPPFRADTAVAMLRRVTEDEPRPIRELNDDIPDWLEAIIFKLLEKNPDERFQSASDVSELLGQHLAHLQDPQSSPRPLDVNAGQSAKRKKRLQEWKSGWGWGVIFFLAMLGARATWYYVTDAGTVVVDADDESLRVVFREILNESKDGTTQKITFNMSHAVEHFGSGPVRLGSGRYFVSLGDRQDEFDVSQDQFTLGRRGKIKIRIRRRSDNSGASDLDDVAGSDGLTELQALDGWVDLLTLAELDRDESGSQWKREDADVVLSSGEHSALPLPVDPGTSYQLRSRFHRRTDGGSIKFWLPTPGGHTELSFNDWYKYHGIQYLDGRMLKDRQTGPALALGTKFAVDESHEMVARVHPEGDELSVSVTLDGKRLFDWTGSPASILQQNPRVKLAEANAVHIGTGTSPGIVWETLEIRTLDADGYALDFDGRSSRVETPVRYDGNHPLTIEAFVTPRLVVDENQVLVGDSQASGLALMLRDDGHWRFGTWDRKQRDYVRAVSERPAVANRRVHLAGVLNDNQTRLYVDGKLQGKPAKFDKMVPSGLPMMIGANWEPGNRFWEHFAGVMDEVRISKVARYNKDNFTPEVLFQSDEDTLALA